VPKTRSAMREDLGSAQVTVSFDESKCDQVFASLDQCHLPGAAVGIAIRGSPVYRKGFGLANMELPVILSPTIRMRIASISKHIVSLAYLLLCEEGRAGIDDPVCRYFPELNHVTHEVTLRQLMGNMGGLHDAFEISWLFSGTSQSVTSEQLLALYRRLDEINAPPGTAWIYNNGGFLILSTAIERISGLSLEEFLRRRVFDPVGMYSTALRRWDTDFIPNSAASHRLSVSGSFEKSNSFGTAWSGEGGVVSTVNDMLCWLAHMDSPKVGNSDTWRMLRTSQTLANGTSTGYGLGLITGRYRGVHTVFHPGGGLGCSAQMIKVPAVGLDIVVMVNREDIHAMMLADQLLDACLDGLEPVHKTRATALASGVFRSPTTQRVIQLFDTGGQQIVSVDGLDLVVEPDERGVLWPIGMWRYYKQGVTLMGDRERPASVSLSDFGNLDVFERQEVLRSADVSSIAGHYRSDSTGSRVSIELGPDGPRLVTAGPFGSTAYWLECLSEGTWRARCPRVDYLGGVLSFDRDCDRGSSGFRFFSSLQRMRGLRFQRAT